MNSVAPSSIREIANSTSPATANVRSPTQNNLPDAPVTAMFSGALESST